MDILQFAGLAREFCGKLAPRSLRLYRPGSLHFCVFQLVYFCCNRYGVRLDPPQNRGHRPPLQAAVDRLLLRYGRVYHIDLHLRRVFPLSGSQLLHAESAGGSRTAVHRPEFSLGVLFPAQTRSCLKAPCIS